MLQQESFQGNGQKWDKRVRRVWDRSCTDYRMQRFRTESQGNVIYRAMICNGKSCTAGNIGASIKVSTADISGLLWAVQYFFTLRVNAAWGFPVCMNTRVKQIHTLNTKYRCVEQAIGDGMREQLCLIRVWTCKSVFWGVSPRARRCPVALCCAVGFPFFKQAVICAWPCLRTTLQQCLVGLSEPGDSLDFLAWRIPIDSFLYMCSLVLARSYC